MTKEATGKGSAKPAKAATSRGRPDKPAPKSTDGVVLLSGGNPQIAKAYGDAPVQQYIAAMPGWKREVGATLDRLIVQAMPNVEKAVKWNSPLYGTERDVWFLGLHCMTKYVKVAFFQGALLHPQPPGASKQKEVRYLDIREGDEIDAARIIDWVQQAGRLPGTRM